MRRLVWLLAAAISAGCPSSNGKPKSAGGDEAGDRLVLFATTEVKGQLEPCGCNSDPMGDIARIVKLVEDARAGGQPVVVVDAGSLLYPHDMTGEVAPEDQQHLQRGELLSKVYGEQLHAAVGLGPFDFGNQPVAPPRQAANMAPGAVVTRAEPEVVQAGKVKVGVFGVAAPSAVKGATDPAAAATSAVAQLRKQGAQVVVGLAHMQKKDARDLARKVPGIDFMIVGQNAPGEPAKVSDVADQVGSTWLVQPANRGQVVSKIEIAVRGGSGGAFSDAVGPARVPILEAKLSDAKAELAKFEKDPAADKGFVRDKRSEVAALEKDLAALHGSPLRVPDKGNWFTLEQVRIRRKLACDPATQAAKKALDRTIGQANLEEAKKKGPPAKPPKGTAGYVGMEECAFCHKDALAFWNKTVHAKAWETLVEVGKELDYDCVKCHVTGWEQPGGSTLAFNENLRDVQCEVCHGPGSLHVAADGKEKKSSLVRATPEDVCIRCHNKEHSDTFDYKAYLRDVTGKGHGETFRATLGDGPVGHELRAAALEKAGREVGAGCEK
ncbi:MAG TPA: multiheme c-type cytochrome [Kofleriaceae bacterium]|jgi:hypothetical protein